MQIGTINYLNLLPFHYFMKRYLKTNAAKASYFYYSSTPSTNNRRFLKRDFVASFVSSVLTQRCHCGNIVIAANGPVYSVLVKPNSQGYDAESNSSNVLADILNIKGEVIIGDKALRYYFKHKEGIDLSNEWKKRYRLPFVFARFCYHGHFDYFKKLERSFLASNKNIPYYYAKKEAKKAGITLDQLKWYLQVIEYQMKPAHKKSLKLFLKLSS